MYEQYDTGSCIPSPKKQTEPITVEKNPNMMYMLVGSYATPDEEGIKVYNFDEQTGNSQYISGIKGISNPSFLIPSADGKRIYTVGEDAGKVLPPMPSNLIKNKRN